MKIKVLRPTALSLLLMLPLALHAQTPAAEPHWRAFQHALGQPARIGDNAQHPLANTAFRPIPQTRVNDVDSERFELGSRLFHEGRLSSGNAIACVTCHAGALSGADRRQVSVGVGGARGTMNALSVFNATFNFRQFWDGRVVTLEDQAIEPIINEVEMANTLEAALDMLQSDASYPNLFAGVYPDGITVQNMADAIAHFQRVNFIRHDTPFQRHLNGDYHALDTQQRRGLQRFSDLGCASCHNGINLGGNSYQQLGAILPFYDEERSARDADDGVFERTGREQDRHTFRVPGLHGVSTTAPYFHDGSIATLEQAIAEMAQHQLGRQLSDDDLADIAAFLRALSGPISFARPEGVSGREHGIQTMSHETAYRSSLAAIGQAEQRLWQAALAVREQRVAHFDFLQFEHRELIRHARALQHPPATAPDTTRQALQRAAEELLLAVEALEWPIADFLRAQALLRIHEMQLAGPEAGQLLTVAELEAARDTQSTLSRDALQQITDSDLDAAAVRIRDVYNSLLMPEQ